MSRASGDAAPCFCITTRRYILSHCTDAAGRFLAIAVGDEDQSSYVDRWGLFIVDTANPARAPMTLDIRVP